MSQFISGVANGAPIWVWPLLIGLIALGLLSSRDRTTPVALYYGLPFIGLLSLNSIASLPQPSTAWIGFALGYVVGVAYGYARQPRWIVGFQGRKVRLRGEWLTMAVLMITFWSNFVGGTVLAISPETYASPTFIGAMTVVIGAAGGAFLGRSVRVLRAARAA